MESEGTGCSTSSSRTRRQARRSSRPALGRWWGICLVDLNVDNGERDVRFSFLQG